MYRCAYHIPQTYLGVVEQFITENDNYQQVSCENGGVIMKGIVI